MRCSLVMAVHAAAKAVHSDFSSAVLHSAFNNIFSNLGYVMLGLLFLLIVLQREIVHKQALDRNDLNALVSIKLQQTADPSSWFNLLRLLRSAASPNTLDCTMLWELL